MKFSTLVAVAQSSDEPAALLFQGYCGELRNYYAIQTRYREAAKKATSTRSRSLSTRFTGDVDHGETQH